jgi:hypothetical protein
MKVETQFSAVTVTDIPNAHNLTSIEVNLQEGFVNLYYKGWVPPTYGTTMSLEPAASPDAARYDGELDDPDHPPTQAIDLPPMPRPVKDNPQA